MTPKGKKKLNKGNMENCLELALHHIYEGKAELLEAGGALTVQVLEARFRTMREELQEVLNRVKRIKKIAKRQSKDIFDIITEEFEFGYTIKENKKLSIFSSIASTSTKSEVFRFAG